MPRNHLRQGRNVQEERQALASACHCFTNPSRSSCAPSWLPPKPPLPAFAYANKSHLGKKTSDLDNFSEEHNVLLLFFEEMQGEEQPNGSFPDVSWA